MLSLGKLHIYICIVCVCACTQILTCLWVEDREHDKREENKADQVQTPLTVAVQSVAFNTESFPSGKLGICVCVSLFLPLNLREPSLNQNHLDILNLNDLFSTRVKSKKGECVCMLMSPLGGLSGWAALGLCPLRWAEDVPLGTTGFSRGLVDISHLPTLAVYNPPEIQPTVIDLTNQAHNEKQIAFQNCVLEGKSKYLKYVSMNVLKTPYPF